MLKLPPFLRSTPAVTWLIPEVHGGICSAIGATCFDDFDTDTFKKALNRDLQGYVALDERGRVVGFLAFYGSSAAIDVDAVAVHPLFRRKGYGRQLVRRLARLAEVRPDRPTWLEVPEDSDPASLAFLTATGWRAKRVHRGSFGDRDGYVFALGGGNEKGACPGGAA